MKKLKMALMGLSLCLLLVNCTAQSGEKSSLDTVEARLRNGARVSSILTDPQFELLRPGKEFRALVKKYADTAAVDIRPEGEPGKRIRITVELVDGNGLPLADRLVYFYQTDARGWYAAGNPHVGGSAGDFQQARLFGYVRSNAGGRLEIHTVKPSGYPQSEFPGHIHFHVENPGGREFVTELLFDDDERLVGSARTQSVRYGFQIAVPGPAPAGFDQQFSYRITVR